MHKALISIAALQLTAAYCGPDVEPTTFTVTVENVSPTFDLSASGVFNTPIGAEEPGPILPWGAYSVTFAAPAGAHLSFATMFVQSNDLFVAPVSDAGLPLFDADGTPRSGDITYELALWDAGTERNQPPGAGSNQPPSQGGPNTGPDDPNSRVRLVNDGYEYPAMNEMLRGHLLHNGGNVFTLELINVADPGTLLSSDGQDVPVIFAPGVFAVHGADVMPLFTEGDEDRGEGLEGLAEDGSVAMLAENLAAVTGLNVPLSPGLLVTHDDGSEPFFTYGEADRGEGLEALAEGGDPSVLAASLQSNAFVWEIAPFNTPDGAAGPAPIFSGDSYTVTFTAAPGESLSLATMFIPSNDGFYSTAAEGLPLFDAHGNALSGDITAAFNLWDAGTEINQMPGTGPDQPLNGGGTSGADDPNDAVRVLDDGYDYPAMRNVLRVELHVH